MGIIKENYHYIDVENEVLEQNFATLSKGQQTKVLLPSFLQAS